MSLKKKLALKARLERNSPGFSIYKFRRGLGRRRSEFAARTGMRSLIHFRDLRVTPDSYGRISSRDKTFTIKLFILAST